MGERFRVRFDLWRALLIALPCLFFLPELTGYSRFAGWDVTRLNLPLKWTDVQSIRESVLPLWNHYLYAGMPQLAESESGLFYPGNFLLHLPGDFFYWAGITYIIHFILAGLFMDLWLRGKGARSSLSFFGAVLFQTAPFLLFHITSMALLQSVVWFPFLLWLADRYSLADENRVKRLYAGIIVILGGLLLTIGSAQMAFYQGFLLFCYLTGYTFQSKDEISVRLKKSLVILLSLAIGAAILGAVIWIPAREFSSGTVREVANRGFYFLGSNWLNPLRLASIFYFPAYGKSTEVVGWASSLMYVGLFPAFLAMLRLFGIRVNWKKDAPLIIMGAVALFLAFGMFNPVNQLLIKFPPFSLFRYQGRLALGVLVALIGLSVNYLSDKSLNPYLADTENPGKPIVDRKLIIWALAVIFIFFLAYIITVSRSKAILIGGAILLVDVLLTWFAVATFRKKEIRRFPQALVLYVLFHLVIAYPVGRLATMRTNEFRLSFKFFDQLERTDSLPPRLLVADVGRFSDRDLLAFNHWTPQTSLPNICAGSASIFEGVQSMDPYTPLRPVEWHSIIREIIGEGFTRSAETGVLDDKSAGWLQLLGIDAVVTSGEVYSIPGYEQVVTDLSAYFGENARLYISKTQQPRAWKVLGSGTGYVLDRNGWKTPPDGATALAQYLEFQGPESAVFERVSWYGGTDGYFYTDGRADQGAENIMMSLGPNSAKVDFEMPSPGWVVMEISYSPDWTVIHKSGDAPPVEVQPYRANATFCAVSIGDAGTHSLEFIYSPRSVIIGGNISAAGLILLAVWFLTCIRRKRNGFPLP